MGNAAVEAPPHSLQVLYGLVQQAVCSQQLRDARSLLGAGQAQAACRVRAEAGQQERCQEPGGRPRRSRSRCGRTPRTRGGWACPRRTRWGSAPEARRWPGRPVRSQQPVGKPRQVRQRPAWAQLQAQEAV